MSDKYLPYGHGVPESVVREYNRMIRHERYLEEQERANGVISMERVDPCGRYLTDHAESLAAENDMLKAQMKALEKAMEWLKEQNPYQYELVVFFYYSDDNTMTVSRTAEHFGKSAKSIHRSLKRAKRKLKGFILSYLSKDEK